MAGMMRLTAHLVMRLVLHLFVHPVACLVFQLIVPGGVVCVPGKAARMGGAVGGAVGGVMVCKVVRFCHGHASCLSAVSCCGAS